MGGSTHTFLLAAGPLWGPQGPRMGAGVKMTTIGPVLGVLTALLQRLT
jgi:hypothetical protein